MGNELDLWVKRPDGTPVVGTVWPGSTYFPDFSKNVTLGYWTKMLGDYKQVVDFDGIWIVSTQKDVLVTYITTPVLC